MSSPSRLFDVSQVGTAVVIGDRDLPANLATPEPALFTLLSAFNRMRDDPRYPNDFPLGYCVKNELSPMSTAACLVNPTSSRKSFRPSSHACGIGASTAPRSFNQIAISRRRTVAARDRHQDQPSPSRQK